RELIALAVTSPRDTGGLRRGPSRGGDGPPVSRGEVTASAISSRNREGRNGSAVIFTPSGASASATALATAAPAATMPSSPAPLTPSRLVGEGSSSRTHTSTGGRSAAAGRWYSI